METGVANRNRTTNKARSTGNWMLIERRGPPVQKQDLHHFESRSILNYTVHSTTRKVSIIDPMALGYNQINLKNKS